METVFDVGIGTETQEMIDYTAQLFLNNRWIMNTNSFFISVFRWIGWMIAKGLTWLAASCGKVFDLAFQFVDFSTYEPLQDFMDSFKPVVIAVISMSLFAIGILLIVNHDKKPKFMINLCMMVLVVSSSAYLFQLMNTALMSGKEAILGSFSAGAVYDTVASNIYDIMYIDEQAGLANMTGEKADYPRYDTITETELDMISINEVINYKTDKMTTQEGREMLKYKLVFYKDKNYGIEEVYNGFGWNSTDDDDWFNEFYYRYKIDWATLYLNLLSLCLVFLFLAWKIFSLLFELGVYRIVALLKSSDLLGTQKTLQVFDAIKNCYIILLASCMMIKFYVLGTRFINDSSLTDNGLIKGIFLIFLALAVINGPELFRKMYGNDAGNSSGFRHLVTAMFMTRGLRHTLSQAPKGLMRNVSGILSGSGGNDPGHGATMGTGRNNQRKASGFLFGSGGTTGGNSGSAAGNTGSSGSSISAAAGGSSGSTTGNTGSSGSGVSAAAGGNSSSAAGNTGSPGSSISGAAGDNSGSIIESPGSGISGEAGRNSDPAEGSGSPDQDTGDISQEVPDEMAKTDTPLSGTAEEPSPLTDAGNGTIPDTGDIDPSQEFSMDPQYGETDTETSVLYGRDAYGNGSGPVSAGLEVPDMEDKLYGDGIPGATAFKGNSIDGGKTPTAFDGTMFRNVSNGSDLFPKPEPGSGVHVEPEASMEKITFLRKGTMDDTTDGKDRPDGISRVGKGV